MKEIYILHELYTIQISTCHRYASICFKTRELLLEFCQNEHLLHDVPVLFLPDYHERIRISIENLPIELPDTEVKNFLSIHATPIGTTCYTGQKYNNKYYTTGTRVYQCIKLIQHLPRHVYEFGRYLRIRYNTQPTPTSITAPENNISKNIPVPANQQTTPEIQPDTTQSTQPHNTASPTNPITPKKQSENTLPNITPIPHSYGTPNETQKQTQQQQKKEKPTQQIEQQPQSDNKPIQPTEQLPANPETQTLTTTTTPLPTLTPFKKLTLSSEEQQSY